MRVKIISPQTTIYDNTATLIQLPGLRGSFEIMEGHAPMISALKSGKIRLLNGKDESFFDINSGTIEISKGFVNILVQ